MKNYVCSNCGANANPDGISAGPYLTCNCTATWVNDGRGGFFDLTQKPYPMLIKKRKAKSSLKKRLKNE